MLGISLKCILIEFHTHEYNVPNFSILFCNMTELEVLKFNARRCVLNSYLFAPASHSEHTKLKVLVMVIYHSNTMTFNSIFTLTGS